MAPCTKMPSPCSKVLLIQELQDLIRSKLPFRDIKTCTLVCRQWNSLFNPFLWTRVELHEHDRGKRTILRRHGHCVVSLNSVHADKKTLRFIRKFCSDIQQLSLMMDHRSAWIHYDYLDNFFTRVPHLTTLQIRFDAFQFNPAMFYSLSRLRNLTRLTMDVFQAQHHSSFSRHYHPDAHMAILDCCPQLQELVVCGLFLEPPRTATQPTQTPFHQWVKRTLQPQQRTHPPAQEVTQDPRHTRTWSSTSMPIHRLSRKLLKTQTHASEDSSHLPTVGKSLITETYRIQRLDFRSKRMDDNVFCNLMRRCPLLEQLTLEGVWVGINVNSWTVLSESCPRLTTLNIHHSDSVHSQPTIETWLPTIETLTAFFPRLEDVTMCAIEFHRDPDLSTLATHLQQLEEQHGNRRALKHIHYSGAIRRPLKVLLDVVTQIRSIESLTVGFTIDAIRPVDEGQKPPLELDKPWICQDTLVHLDLISVSFADWTLFGQFFDHVQQLTQLKSLWISISHVREARGISASAQDAIPLTPTRRRSSSTSDDSSVAGVHPSSVSMPLLKQHPHVQLSSSVGNGSPTRPPGSFFWFRTLEILRIGMAYYLNNRQWFERPVVYEEVAYVLQGTPALKQLDLKHMSESGVVKRLSTQYPRIAFS
ncbi:hypothetical protein BGZ75_001977 [Mortierella antarctica]|nr:hypothetical protein BGZ75_001977 [Mortierella antarctica]